ncbi:hypothetical protein Poly21_45780 [Allorhodopirellula heiligendammensis]|uniref:Uncharacterized protein n=1 Tax=Allorhodopirellula heiligendammensis TaxID=2714739 RepID=A0A5C6BG50_9BACT|nr:hypothetical protein Poly21_45780 [Allorhodopirellula heiligendammensis]
MRGDVDLELTTYSSRKPTPPRNERGALSGLLERLAPLLDIAIAGL